MAIHDGRKNTREPDRTDAESYSQKLPPVWEADPIRLERGERPLSDGMAGRTLRRIASIKGQRVMPSARDSSGTPYEL